MPAALCPSCGALLILAPHQAGETTACPRCKALLPDDLRMVTRAEAEDYFRLRRPAPVAEPKEP